MSIPDDTVVSTQTNTPNIIDYTLGLLILLQQVDRIAFAQETAATKLAEIAVEEVKQTAEAVKQTVEAVKQTAEAVKQTAEAIKQTLHLQTIAEEAIKHTLQLTIIAAEDAAQTPLVERIAVADEGVWQCCRSGRGDQEAFVEINMRYHNETPAQRWARYEAFLMRDAGIPNETP